MNKDKFKARTKQARGKVKELGGKLIHDRLLEKKGLAQKIGDKIQPVYGDFKEDFLSNNDLKDDIQGYGDFRDDLQKSG